MEKGMESGTPAEQEGTEQSIQETSGQQAERTSSQEAQSVAELLQSEEASGIVAGLVAKEFQKNKDKRLADVPEIKSEVARLRELVEGKGMSFDEAEAQVGQEKRQAVIEGQLTEILANKATLPSDEGKSWIEREAAILGAKNVDQSDPEFIRFKREFDDPEKYLEALPDKVWQLQSRPTGTEGSASGGQGTQVNEDLEAEYNSRLALLRGNVQGILALKKEMRGKGLDKW